ncbi:MAG: hypothetical protein IJC75_00425 [Oscillospiraceae bacterium]|nr:hypothetical protein [Oscillospiraceae bacterium]
MKNTLKTAAAIMVVVLSSVIGCIIAAYVYLCIASAFYWTEGNPFDIYNISALLMGILLPVDFLFTYMVSMVYLCKRMYRIRKWMVCIPILVSLLIVFLSIVFIWRDYQII